MRRVAWICIAWISAMGMAQAQSGFDLILDKEGKIVALPKNKTYELQIPKVSYQTFTPRGSRDVDIKLRELAPVSQAEATLPEHPMDMRISSAAYQPFFNIYTPMIREVSPMALDFNETYIKRLNERFEVIANGTQYTWPGAGGMTLFNTGLSWKSGRWQLYGGGFGGRFFTPFNPSPGITAGLHLQATYQATDWLRIRGWGQYAYYGDEGHNPHMLRNPFYNHTQVGGAFEFRVTENFWIGTGVNFEFNPMNNRMEPQFMVYPAVQTRHFRIGM